jgi:SAM-dependent methyltransferase
LKHNGVLILDQRNYDAIIDHGFSTKHKYYYCGEKVVAEPEYVDEGLCRMKYNFPDGSSFTLNMFPLRKNYTRKLLLEAGFQRVRTYGDFQETYQESEPDFFVHIAEKSALRETRWDSAGRDEETDDVREVTEDYYDSDDADTFYSVIWGGEDVHVGIYEETDSIRQASATTVERMAAMLGRVDKNTKVLDIGAGYGGSARYLARTFGCQVRCLNISETQNDTNRVKNRQQGLADLVSVVHGVFEDIPEADSSYDVVWSQDAILHSDQRAGVLAEVFRVLRPGGLFIFTDPMQADDCPPDVLQPVYDRLSLTSLGSFRFYREAAQQVGFEVLDQVELTEQLRSHYTRVGEELRRNYDKLLENISRDYMDRMLIGLDNWVKAADAGHLAWGIQRFRKPA